MDEQPIPRGRIHDLGSLNLLSAKTPEDFAGIESISDVGSILVPASLAMALTRIPIHDVGTIAAIPDGEPVSLINGQVTLTGESLAAGDPDRLLVIVGQVFIPTPVSQVGYKGIHLVGQMIAARGSEAALGAAMREVIGQVIYIPEGARMIMGHERFGRDFLEALPRRTPFVIFGHVEFENDVDAALVRETIPEIVLFGKLRAPRSVAPILQAITEQKFGEIEAI